MKEDLQFPGHHLHAVSDGEWIINSCVLLSYVAVVSKPRIKVPGERCEKSQENINLVRDSFQNISEFWKKIINHSFHYTVQTFMLNLCVFTLQGEISTI